jgi:hypothetical protein
MPRTADFHDQISDARLPEAAEVVDDAAALDATVDVLEADTPASEASIASFLRACEGSAPRLPGRHDDFHLVQRECQEAEVLEPPAACR